MCFGKDAGKNKPTAKSGTLMLSMSVLGQTHRLQNHISVELNTVEWMFSGGGGEVLGGSS